MCHKPSPPTVPLELHVGAVEGLKWTAHHHLPVFQGGGAEKVASGGGGDYGERREGLPGLRKAT